MWGRAIPTPIEMGGFIAQIIMRALVTGCAGFIGSNLAEKLIGEGYEVVGIGCFSDYYPRKIKEKNMAH